MAEPNPDLHSRLDRVDLFRGLAASDLAAVGGTAREIALAQGEILFHQGDAARTFYVLLYGRVRLSQVTAEGQQVIMRYVNPGEGFGLGAVLSKLDYPLSAEAVEASRLLAWDGAVLHDLMARYSRIALNAVETLVQQVHDLQDRYRELATERVERRIARALLRLARQSGRKTSSGILIDLALSRQDLAELTGTTLYTVSRVLSRWEEQGLIEAGRERVVIRRPHGLVAVAEDLPPSTT